MLAIRSLLTRERRSQCLQYLYYCIEASIILMRRIHGYDTDTCVIRVSLVNVRFILFVTTLISYSCRIMRVAIVLHYFRDLLLYTKSLMCIYLLLIFYSESMAKSPHTHIHAQMSGITTTSCWNWPVESLKWSYQTSDLIYYDFIGQGA